ncbi:MAG: type II toxin-antitoxin system HicB family antitoxin [Elusimicrobia bacterium]|nr:type II toxin-antitoxin system HicB family antitoxin [Elusimicrobiota bacterium]
METKFTLEYWIDDGWYVGRLREVPGIFSQGATLKELEENVKDAYKLVMQDQPSSKAHSQSKKILVPA